jgi:hypothetical protein
MTLMTGMAVSLAAFALEVQTHQPHYFVSLEPYKCYHALLKTNFESEVSTSL